MHRLINRKFIIKKKSNNNTLESSEEKKKVTETELLVNDTDTIDDDHSENSLHDKNLKSNTLVLYCIYPLDLEKSIDELIPNIGLKFLQNKNTSINIIFHDSNLDNLEGVNINGSLYKWEMQNSNRLISDKISINLINQEVSIENIRNNVEDSNLLIFIVDNLDFRLDFGKVIIKDFDNDVVFDKKNDNYEIFNPISIEKNILNQDYKFYSMAKQKAVKNMFQERLDEIVKKFGKLYGDEISSAQKPDYKNKVNSLFNNFSEYFNNKEELQIEFNKLNTPQKLNNFFKLKLNKVLMNEYNYAYLIN